MCVEGGKGSSTHNNFAADKTGGPASQQNWYLDGKFVAFNIPLADVLYLIFVV